MSIYHAFPILVVSALIPLAEFSDVTKTYGVSPDKETIEILTQVAHQRGVGVILHFICTFSVLSSCSPFPLEVAVCELIVDLLELHDHRLKSLRKYSMATLQRSCMKQSTWFH
jgi:hypothetical protein